MDVPIYWHDLTITKQRALARRLGTTLDATPAEMLWDHTPIGTLHIPNTLDPTIQDIAHILATHCPECCCDDRADRIRIARTLILYATITVRQEPHAD